MTVSIFSFEALAATFTKLFSRIPFTLMMVAASMGIGSILGLLLAKWKMGRNGILRKLSFGYSAVIRGTPFLVLLFVTYYGLPLALQYLGVNMNQLAKSWFLLIALSMMAGSRLSDVFRSAYEAVDKGQIEASYSVGLTGWQAFKRIMLPQAAYISLPNMGNTLLGIMMETSLGYNIGVFDLMGQAKQINALSYGVHTMEVYVAVGLIYWGFSLLLDKGTNVLEKHMGRHYKALTQIKAREGARS